MLNKIIELMDEGRSFVTATVIDSGTQAPKDRKLIVLPDGTLIGSTGDKLLDAMIASLGPKAVKTGPELATFGAATVFFDPHLPTPRLVICGAGHIALPLARFGLELEYAVTVIDDREDFASEKRFPGCTVVAGDFGEALAGTDFNLSTYAVVITRGHEHDVECLKNLIPRHEGYIGLIGSRRRVGFVKKELLAAGFDAGRVENLYTPIGLPIGAESPAEIAVSILAEITAVKRLGRDKALDLRNKRD